MPCPFLCRNLTCLNPRCPLCCQNPNKRCPDSVHFASKYLEKNPLKSRCGANIRIEVVSGTGEPAHPHLLQDVVLEVRFRVLACNVLDSQLSKTSTLLVVQLSMVDGKKYGSRNETGEDIASCELFTAPTKAGSKADKVRPNSSRRRQCPTSMVHMSKAQAAGHQYDACANYLPDALMTWPDSTQ